MKWSVCLVLVACTGCGREDVAPADPVAVDQLLTRLESTHGAVERVLPAKASEKLHRAERLIAPLEKVQADKIDPAVAIAFIGR